MKNRKDRTSYRFYRFYGIRGTSILICIACAVLLFGCEAKTRYQVLSFIFDGVPVPENPAGGAASPGGKSPSGDSRQHASTHGPYAARMCEACHQKGTNALLAPREQLCFRCHTFPMVRRQHGPVVAGGCLVCHDPHRSSNSFLLVAEAKEFCFYCHDKNEVMTRDAHRGVDISCTECHNPHGSDNDYFFR